MLEQQSAMQNPQGDLFAAAAIAEVATEETISPVIAALNDMQPDELSPKAALEMLYRLKQLL
jgi:DNA mismatch repair protein MutS